MNGLIASTLTGAVAIPVLGLGWEFIALPVATFFEIPWTKRTTSVLFGANALSGALAFYMLVKTPLE